MKKRKLIILILPMLTACIALGIKPMPVNASEPGIKYEYTTNNIFNDFLDAHPNRTPFTSYEAAAANFLAQAFKDAGFAENLVSVRPFKVKTTAGDEYDSQNVVAVYRGKSGNSKSVIIGAGYSNSANKSPITNATEAEGALLNATGVAALMGVAYYMAQNTPELPFDIVFAAFGATNATDSYGADAYVDSESGGMGFAEIMSTMLMVNFHAVGGGDFAYLYCDERPTAHDSYLCNAAVSTGAELRELPKNRAVTKTLHSSSGLPFVHIGTEGAQAPFYSVGIRTAKLMGYNAEYAMFDPGSESAGLNDLAQTASDDRVTLYARYGMDEVHNRIKAASDSVIAALVADPDAFATAMQQEYRPASQTFWYNPVYIRVVKAVVILILVVIVFFAASALKKKPAPMVSPNPSTPKDAPKREAVFGEGYEKGEPPAPKPHQIDPFDGY